MSSISSSPAGGTPSCTPPPCGSPQPRSEQISVDTAERLVHYQAVGGRTPTLSFDRPPGEMQIVLPSTYSPTANMHDAIVALAPQAVALGVATKEKDFVTTNHQCLGRAKTKKPEELQKQEQCSPKNTVKTTPLDDLEEIQKTLRYLFTSNSMCEPLFVLNKLLAARHESVSALRGARDFVVLAQNAISHLPRVPPSECQCLIWATLVDASTAGLLHAQLARNTHRLLYAESYVSALPSSEQMVAVVADIRGKLLDTSAECVVLMAMKIGDGATGAPVVYDTSPVTGSNRGIHELIVEPGFVAKVSRVKYTPRSNTMLVELDFVRDLHLFAKFPRGAPKEAADQALLCAPLDKAGPASWVNATVPTKQQRLPRIETGKGRSTGASVGVLVTATSRMDLKAPQKLEDRRELFERQQQLKKQKLEQQEQLARNESLKRRRNKHRNRAAAQISRHQRARSTGVVPVFFDQELSTAKQLLLLQASRAHTPPPQPAEKVADASPEAAAATKTAAAEEPQEQHAATHFEREWIIEALGKLKKGEVKDKELMDMLELFKEYTKSEYLATVVAHNGGTEVFTELLRLHKDNVAAVQHTLRIIAACAKICPGERETAVVSGTHNLLMDIVAMYQNRRDVLTSALSALTNISSYRQDHFPPELVKCVSCVVGLLKTFADSPDICNVVCLVLRNMCMEPKCADVLFDTPHGLESLLSTMDRFETNHVLARSVCVVIKMMCKNKEHCEKLAATDTIKHVADAFTRHSNVVGVCLEATSVFAHLAAFEQGRKKIEELGLVRKVVGLVQDMYRSTTVGDNEKDLLGVTLCLFAYNLSGDLGMVNELRDCRTTSLLFRVLEQNSSLSVCVHACTAISAIICTVRGMSEEFTEQVTQVMESVVIVDGKYHPALYTVALRCFHHFSEIARAEKKVFVRLTGSVANLLIKTPKELLQDPLNANMLASILVDSSEQGNWEEAIMLAGRIMSCSQSAPETCGLCCTALLGLYSASDEDDAKKWLMSTIGVLRTVMPIHVSSVSFVVPALRLLNFMVSLDRGILQSEKKHLVDFLVDSLKLELEENEIVTDLELTARMLSRKSPALEIAKCEFRVKEGLKVVKGATTGPKSSPLFLKPMCKLIVVMIDAGLGDMVSDCECLDLVCSYEKVKPNEKCVRKALAKLYTLPAYQDRADRMNPLTRFIQTWIPSSS